MSLSRMQSEQQKDQVPEAEIRSLLAQSTNSGKAIRGLYNLWKKKQKSFSIALLCKRAKISSKGYLSDVMAGKRTLHLKYQDSLVKAFRLKRENAHYLRLLIAYDSEKDDAKRARLKERLVTAKKALNVQYMRISNKHEGIFAALEVFCSFGLFKGHPAEAQLLEYFSEMPRTKLIQCLELLQSMQLITKEADGSFRSLTDHFLLGEAEADFSHIEFVKLALAHADKSVEKWFPQKNKSYFVSSVLSVRMKHFEETIDSLKSKLLLVQADLESPDADSLVRFNVQIYPTR